jgi:hypothetical protein
MKTTKISTMPAVEQGGERGIEILERVAGAGAFTGLFVGDEDGDGVDRLGGGIDGTDLGAAGVFGFDGGGGDGGGGGGGRQGGGMGGGFFGGLLDDLHRLIEGGVVGHAADPVYFFLDVLLVLVEVAGEVGDLDVDDETQPTDRPDQEGDHDDERGDAPKAPALEAQQQGGEEEAEHDRQRDGDQHVAGEVEPADDDRD